MNAPRLHLTAARPPSGGPTAALSAPGASNGLPGTRSRGRRPAPCPDEPADTPTLLPAACFSRGTHRLLRFTRRGFPDLLCKQGLLAFYPRVARRASCRPRHRRRLRRSSPTFRYAGPGRPLATARAGRSFPALRRNRRRSPEDGPPRAAVAGNAARDEGKPRRDSGSDPAHPLPTVPGAVRRTGLPRLAVVGTAWEDEPGRRGPHDGRQPVDWRGGCRCPGAGRIRRVPLFLGPAVAVKNSLDGRWDVLRPP